MHGGLKSERVLSAARQIVLHTRYELLGTRINTMNLLQLLVKGALNEARIEYYMYKSLNI